MSRSAAKCLLLLGFALLLSAMSGCSEGPMWRLGYLNPWVRQKWSDEEKIKSTLFTRRARLRSLASNAKNMKPAERDRISRDLANLLREDSVTLLRIEAVRTLAKFRTEAATQALREAAADADADVRIAAVEAWEKRRDPVALNILQERLASDTEIDVRLAATRALGSFPDSPQLRTALGIALDDPDPAMQHLAMRSLKSVTDRPYGTSQVAWREFLNGGNPPPAPGPSVADYLREWF